MKISGFVSKAYFILASFLFDIYKWIPKDIHLYVFGDSHSDWPYSIFKKVNSRVILHNHSKHAKTLHGATRLGKKFVNFKRVKVKNDSIVMINFGEIDSRSFLHRFKGKGLYTEIRRLVNAYEKLILENMKDVPKVHIWIGGLVPTTEFCKFTPLGSSYERLLYSRLLNEEIHRMAIRNDFFFIDNYEDYADENGFLNMTISDMSVHIRKDQFTFKTKLAIANEIERIYGHKQLQQY